MTLLAWITFGIACFITGVVAGGLLVASVAYLDEKGTGE